MITITLANGFLIYLLLGIGVVLGLWIYYDLRDKSLYQAERSKAVFHCVKCGKIYAKKMEVKRSTCPRCQFRNTHLEF